MKFKFYIEYNGTNYSGWQMQKNSKSIQGVLIDVIRKALSETKGKAKYIDFQGSGRTDKGVHAYEQVAHLECETMLGPEILKLKVNDLLPSDINVLEVEKAKDNFHARHSAKERQYVYRISTRRTAFEKKFVWWIKDNLDVKKMEDAAKIFVGMHDFQSFSERDKDKVSTRVSVEGIEVLQVGYIIEVRIWASHFLWKMVRRIVGSLVEVGRGNLSKEDLKSALEQYTEDFSKYTAPPSGLFLERVEY